MPETWLSTLITPDAQICYNLAFKFSHIAVKMTQSDVDIREKLRPAYAGNAANLLAISHIAAVNFQTVPAPNGYWCEKFA